MTQKFNYYPQAFTDKVDPHILNEGFRNAFDYLYQLRNDLDSALTEITTLSTATPAVSTPNSHILLDGKIDSDTVNHPVVKGDLIYGNATPKWDGLTAGAEGYVVTMVAGLPAWQPVPTTPGTPHILLDANIDSDTINHPVVAGDLIYGNATPKWDGLAKGTDGTILTMLSGLPDWAGIQNIGHTTTVLATETFEGYTVGQPPQAPPYNLVSSYNSETMTFAGYSYPGNTAGLIRTVNPHGGSNCFEVYGPSSGTLDNRFTGRDTVYSLSGYDHLEMTIYVRGDSITTNYTDATKQTLFFQHWRWTAQAGTALAGLVRTSVSGQPLHLWFIGNEGQDGGQSGGGTNYIAFVDITDTNWHAFQIKFYSDRLEAYWDGVLKCTYTLGSGTVVATSHTRYNHRVQDMAIYVDDYTLSGVTTCGTVSTGWYGLSGSNHQFKTPEAGTGIILDTTSTCAIKFSVDTSAIQTAGPYITSLTGDVTASGPGAAAATIAAAYRGWTLTGTVEHLTTASNTVVIGADTSPNPGTLTVANSLKATASPFDIINVTTADASNPLVLEIGHIGSATAASRRAFLQASEAGVASRNLHLQPNGADVMMGSLTVNLTTGPDFTGTVFGGGTRPAWVLTDGTTSTYSQVVGGVGYIGTLSNHPLFLQSNGSNAVQIDTSQNVIVGGGTSASELRLLEPSGSGTNYTGFKAQAMVANLVYSLPTAQGAALTFIQNDGSGVLTWAAAQAPGNYITALTGDVTASGPGSAVATLASIITAGGPTGSATVAPIITYDAKGRLTAVSSATITPAVGSITGLGSGIATWLATPTSANLASALTNETGTGFVVFSDSPALTSSPTAPTQSFGTNDTTIATTAFVQAASLGQNFKEACRVATTANLVGVYLNGASGVGATFTYTATGTDVIDGVTLVLGDRVLVKNQTTAFQNGIYTCTTAGAPGIAGVLTRTTDANQSGEYKTGDSVFITAGTTQATTTWAYTGIDSPTMGATSLTYVQAAGQGSFTSGNGITITGVSIAIDTSVTVDKTTAQTLTNKTLTSPVLTTPDLGTPTALVGTNISGTGASFTAGKATILATARTLWGQSFDGSANVSGAITGVSAITASGTIQSSNSMTVSNASGTNRGFFGDDNVTPSHRWFFGVTGTAETGSNAGSDFQFYRYSDTGVYLGTAVTFKRSSGAVYFGGDGPPAAQVDIKQTTEQLRLTYTDGSVYTSFTTNSSGNLAIEPTGGSILTTATIAATGSRVTKLWATNITSTNAVVVDSSRAWKHDILPYDADALSLLQKMQPASFIFNEDKDPSGQRKLSVIAESIGEPLAVVDGRSIDTMALTAMSIRGIQQLADKVLALEAEVYKSKGMK